MERSDCAAILQAITAHPDEPEYVHDFVRARVDQTIFDRDVPAGSTVGQIEDWARNHGCDGT
jgi:hypothetical protein